MCICPDVYWITEIFLFLFGSRVGVMEILAVLVSLMISNILFIPTVIIPSRWKTPYNVPDSYNCQNPFYVHGMLNDKKESKYALPIRKNGKLKSFLFLRKIMILWLGVYFTYLGMQYVNPGINSTVIEILLNISLAFMIMAKICMVIFYVNFIKRIINTQQIKKKLGAIQFSVPEYQYVL